MKVAIVDDVIPFVEALMVACSELGHEVLGVHLSPNPDLDKRFAYLGGEEGRTHLHTRDLDEVVRRLREFAPDRLLVDHDFRMGVTGQDLVEELDLSRAVCIGISDRYQDYCSKSFGKMNLRDIRTEQGYESLTACLG